MDAKSPTEVQSVVHTLMGRMVVFSIPAYLGYDDPRKFGRALLRDSFDLNEKELEAIPYIVRGLTNGELCEALGLADEKSASNRVQSIQTKMGLKNRTQIAVVAAWFGFGAELLQKPGENQ